MPTHLHCLLLKPREARLSFNFWHFSPKMFGLKCPDGRGHLFCFAAIYVCVRPLAFDFYDGVASRSCVTSVADSVCGLPF